MLTQKLLLAAVFLASPSLLHSQEAAADDTGKVAPKSAWLTLTPDQRSTVMSFAEPYKAYLRQAKSASLSEAALAALAQQSGFTPFTSPSQVRPGARLIVNNRDRAVAFVVIGSEPIEHGSRMVATHEDSPHINLKSRPVIQAPGSIALFKTTLYGGIKKYQWSNLPLALVGRIDTIDGRHLKVSIGFAPGDPVFVIADNAPHSDTELRNRTYTTVLAGEEMDPVVGSIPGDHSTVAAQVMATLRQRFNIRDEDLVAAELELVPATQPADVGIDLGLTGSWGQDDKLSSYVAARAIFDLKGTPARTAITYVTNFEETGSVNNTGAGSQFIDTLYTQLVDAQSTASQHTPATPVAIRAAMRNAEVLSADCNDGINPLFPHSSEESNAAIVGYGVTIKRYGGGFDPNSEFTARILHILDAGHIPWQTQTPRVEVGGGGTIGGFLSARNMEVLDVGIPLLSMHATYEMSSKVDLWEFYRFFSAFYTTN
jgi:aspartyl aminopeptidase